ncbi:Protein Y71H2B.1 [Aphelenchoides avenae]|nr:Protein Y71H2B.1 [Aphelenchus avenae]
MDFNLDPERLPPELKIKWVKWKLEEEEARHRAKEWAAYWERRKVEDRDLLRDRDFEDAVFKVGRAGYKGKHGNFTVPGELRWQLDALYMQVTIGDHDGRICAYSAEWSKLKGTQKIDAQRRYIRLTNEVITKYGWNRPPDYDYTAGDRALEVMYK